ncbi:catalytic/ coenzyme binding protein, partial [Striga asiatica]
ESDDLDGSKSFVKDSLLTEKKAEQIIATKAAPQSPFTAYENLKPPTPPTPTPSTGPGPTSLSIVVDSISSKLSNISIDNVGTNKAAPKKKHASSPYINYEDLKPPSSPTPTPSGSKKEFFTASISSEVTVGNNNVVKSESTDVGKEHTKTPAYRLSPYLA